MRKVASAKIHPKDIAHTDPKSQLLRGRCRLSTYSLKISEQWQYYQQVRTEVKIAKVEVSSTPNYQRLPITITYQSF